MSNQFVKAGYNKVAKEYLKNRGTFQNKRHVEKLIQLLPKGSSVLDIGCGAGIPIDKYLLEQGYKVTGLDISEKQIELARKNLPTASFEIKDMSELKDNEYHLDAVVSFYAIFHIPREQHKNLLHTINTFLKPNGLLLITMGYSDWVGEEDFFGAPMAWSHFGYKKNLELIADAGFEILWHEIDTSGNEKHLVVLAKKV